MRPIEILLVLINFIYLISYFISKKSGSQWLKYLPVLGLVIAGAQILLEHIRWQIVPVHILTIIFFLNTAKSFYYKKESFFQIKKGWIISALILLFLSTLVAVILPVPKIPEPEGPYNVGTSSFFWTDNTRQETLSPANENSARRLMVQVWYPAERGQNTHKSTYLNGISLAGKIIAQKLGGFSFVFNHLELVKTNAWLDIPVLKTDTPYPVVLFSHGWTGFRTQNTHQAEELASQGYIVFAPDHTYGALLTIFPDDKIILNNPALLPSDASEEETDKARRKLGEAWSGDLTFVLDQIERLNSGEINSQFSGMLDLEKIGVFGHSTGGGAAVETCWSDPRCKAGLAMDAWLQPYSQEMPESGLNVPFLFMESETWQENNENEKLFNTLFENSQSDIYLLKIANTKHFDFADIPLLTPLSPYLNFKGSIKSDYIIKINRTFALSFFDTYLKGKGDLSLGTLSKNFPEITYREK